MECESCRTNNDPGRRYCRRCGLLLGGYCPRCGFVNANGDDYCGGCGCDLGEPVTAASAADAATLLREAAPRQTAPSPDVPEDELDLLFSQTPPPQPAASPEPPASISQTDIDSFFQNLSEKGDAELRRPAPGAPPSDPAKG